MCVSYWSVVTCEPERSKLYIIFSANLSTKFTGQVNGNYWQHPAQETEEHHERQGLLQLWVHRWGDRGICLWYIVLRMVKPEVVGEQNSYVITGIDTVSKLTVCVCAHVLYCVNLLRSVWETQTTAFQLDHKYWAARGVSILSCPMHCQLQAGASCTLKIWRGTKYARMAWGSVALPNLQNHVVVKPSMEVWRILYYKNGLNGPQDFYWMLHFKNHPNTCQLKGVEHVVFVTVSPRIVHIL